MVSDDVAASADWITGSTVRAEDTSVAVEAGEVISAAAVGLLARTIKNIVWLVGSVHHVTPEESGAD